MAEKFPVLASNIQHQLRNIQMRQRFYQKKMCIHYSISSSNNSNNNDDDNNNEQTN